ncbi:hypothetical protein JCM10212_000407 [Sporobolomyces blumeae]
MLSSRFGSVLARLTRRPSENDSRPVKRRRLSSLRPRFNVLFFGADSFSCVTLETLYRNRKDLIDHLVVVTPPDQRTGRRLKEVHRPPLRLLAEQLGITSISLPRTLLTDWTPPSEFVDPSGPSSPPSSRPASILLTASFGHLIPTSVLDRFAPLHALNLHPSLLPRYRGAAPIQWGIVHGEADLNWGQGATFENGRAQEGEVYEGANGAIKGGMGVTVQALSRDKFDRGRILAQRKVVVPRDPGFSTLEPILARHGSNLVVEVLRNLQTYQLNATRQDPLLATSAPKLHKESARVDWDRMNGVEIGRRQRAFGHQQQQVQLVLTRESSNRPIRLDRSLVPSLAPLASTPPSGTSEQPLPTMTTGPDTSPREEQRPVEPGTCFYSSRDKKLYVVVVPSPRSGLFPCPDQPPAKTSLSPSPSPPESHGAQGHVEVVEVEKVKKEGGKWILAREWWDATMSKTNRNARTKDEPIANVERRARVIKFW